MNIPLKRSSPGIGNVLAISQCSPDRRNKNGVTVATCNVQYREERMSVVAELWLMPWMMTLALVSKAYEGWDES